MCQTLRKRILAPPENGPYWRAILIGFLFVCLLEAMNAEEFVFRHENILGTSMELQISALSLQDAQQAEEAALEEIDRLNVIFNTYDPQSIISKFSQVPLNIPLYLPAELLEVFVACDWWRTKTNGAFNPLIEESSLLWKESARSGNLPDAASIAKAQQSSSQSAWKIDPAFETAMRIQDVKINLNAIAKGFIIDRASQAAQNASTGIDSVLLSIGGDLRVSGSIRKSVGIADPANSADNAPALIALELMNHSVTTSANYERGYEIQGKRYSHIIDPRTGYPASSEVQSASVIAANATQADALSTALMVLSLDEGIELIESLPETECLLVTQDGAMRRSSGLHKFINQQVQSEATGASWQEGYELLVEFKINQPDTRRYQRPFIAIWIEDADNRFVKALCLWAELGSSYLNKLSRWDRLEGRDWQRLNTLTKATRRPGNYKLIWDGTDEAGNQLPFGKYAIFIEAVREHGSHTLIREEITLGTEAIERNLKGNLEIKSASLHYSRNTP